MSAVFTLADIISTDRIVFYIIRPNKSKKKKITFINYYVGTCKMFFVLVTSK